jgi:hypothetical protein
MCAGFRLVNLLFSMFAVRKRISCVSFLFQARDRSCVHQSCFTVNWLLFWRKEVFLISTVARNGHFRSFVRYLPNLWMRLQRICWQSKLHMCKWFNSFFQLVYQNIIQVSFVSSLHLYQIAGVLETAFCATLCTHAPAVILPYCYHAINSLLFTSGRPQ